MSRRTPVFANACGTTRREGKAGGAGRADAGMGSVKLVLVDETDANAQGRPGTSLSTDGLPQLRILGWTMSMSRWLSR